MDDLVPVLVLSVCVAWLVHFAWTSLPASRHGSLPFVWRRSGVVLVKIELTWTSSFWGWPAPGKDRLEPSPMVIHLQTWSSFVRRGRPVPAALSAVIEAVLEPGLSDDGTLVRLESDPVSVVLERARTFEALSAPPRTVRFDGGSVTRV